MFENPAVSLYRFWREAIRFHAEHEVQTLRRDSVDRPTSGLEWGDAIERWSLSSRQWARETLRAPLNYRLGLSVTGLSARHIDPGMVAPMLDEYEPVITLNVMTYRQNRYALMTLFPNGDFQVDGTPYDWYQIYPRWTFFRTSYAAGRRVWMLPTKKDQHLNVWSSLQEKDYTTARPYVPNKTFDKGCHYRLVLDKNGFWRFASTGLLASDETRAAKKIEAGYDACDRRYERARRMVEKTPPTSQRHRLALYIPKHGRMTGQEAINEMASHMQVYTPAPKPEEANNANDHLVTSPIHC